MKRIKEALSALLSKTKTLEEATVGFTAEDLSSLETLVKTARSMADNAKECCKVDGNGQWKIEKAIKPGPTLDYSKINPKPDPAAEANAPTIDYGKLEKPKAVWEQKTTPSASKEAWIKANSAKRERTMSAEKKGIKLDKNEGALLEEEPTSSQKARMVVKAEEPHKDDSKHEEKEKKKAKSIRDKAQEILDLH